jgi:glycerol-3-phosphate dehydrogenase
VAIALRRDLGVLTAREHDVLVIGGGVSGAAIAWDAALRGLRVALVEAGDFGAGTSWNSLKTIHGGLRHLQRANLVAVRSAARERSAFLRIAPALVRPLDFLVPTRGHGLRGREALGIALRASDALTMDRNHGLDAEHSIPRGRLLSPAEVHARVPGLSPAGLSGGALWTDAQVSSSERLVLAFLHSASAFGAVVANYVTASGLTRDTGGRITGAACRDGLRGDALAVRARVTINAAGPGLDSVLAASGVDAPRIPLLRAWNLVLRRRAGPDVAVGGQADGRFLFLVPWRDRTIVGTGYEDPDAPSGGVRAFLADAARAFPWAEIVAGDVALVHDGLVPGRRDAGGLWTGHRVRDHARDGAPGLISALGVKFTGARALAEAAVDAALGRLGRPKVSSRTETVTLHRAAPATGGLEEATRAAVREEMAVHLTDAVLRRLDLGTPGPPPASDIATVLAVMAPALGWDESAQATEIAALDAFYAARTL